MKYLLVLIAAGSIALSVAGCGSKNGQGLIAPARPLSQPEEDLLKKLEALPQGQRKDFVNKNGKAIMNFSEHNKTFGDRMNADLGVRPSF